MTPKHPVHKYYKARLGKKIIYRCGVPNCAHYVLRELVTNKLSICWKCGKPFLLQKAVSLLKKYPWCEDCTETRKVKKPNEVPTDILKDILGSLSE